MGGGGADPHGGMMGAGEKGALPTKGADGRNVVGPLSLAIPAGWEARPTSSGMRAAEWTVPAVKGSEAAELVAFYFGNSGAGSVDDNIARWADQFQGPDGAPAQPKKSTRTVAGMAVTLVELEGHYVAAMQPGSAEKADKPDHMMLAAIIETSAGPYYYKLTGPKKTVSAVRAAFAKLVADLQAAPAK
jgi:hypothetical protein